MSKKRKKSELSLIHVIQLQGYHSQGTPEKFKELKEVRRNQKKLQNFGRNQGTFIRKQITVNQNIQTTFNIYYKTNSK